MKKHDQKNDQNLFKKVIVAQGNNSYTFWPYIASYKRWVDFFKVIFQIKKKRLLLFKLIRCTITFIDKNTT